MDEQTLSNGQAVHGMLWHLRDEHHAARTKVGRRKLRLFNVKGCHVEWITGRG